jgi:hypothetical protein
MLQEQAQAISVDISENRLSRDCSCLVAKERVIDCAGGMHRATVEGSPICVALDKSQPSFRDYGNFRQIATV